MSGEWIKMRHDLPDDPDVVGIAGKLGLDEFAVVGRLHRLWSWADKHSVDGKSLLVNTSWIDRYVNAPGFCGAMVSVGWLNVTADDSICIPNFDRHNGESAKKRASGAARVAAHRSGKSVTSVTQESQAAGKRSVLPRPIVNEVMTRDNFCCRYCGRKQGEFAPHEQMADGVLSIDHVIPLTRGGSNEINNLVTACKPCNTFKSDRTPAECGLEWPIDADGKRFGCNENPVTRVTNNLLPEEEEEEEKKKSLKEESPKGDSSAEADKCPHNDIVDAYHRILPELTRVRVWDSDRQKFLRARWREDPRRQSVKWWEKFFGYVRNCPLLMGQVQRASEDDRPAWQADLEWLIRPKNFRKVIERKYEKREAA